MAVTAVISTTRTLYFTSVVSEFESVGTSATSPATITNYAWDFGDGTTTSGTDSTGFHRYTTAGSYTVTLTVTDSTAATSTATLNITVDSSIIDTSKQLRRYIIAFMDTFNGLTVSNNNGSTVSVPIHWGSTDRVVAYIQSELTPGELKRAQDLPIMSASMTKITPAYHRTKYNYQKRYVVDYTLNQAQIEFTPTPVDLTFELGIWSYDYATALSLLETIIPWFNPAIMLNIGDVDYTSDNNLELMDVSDRNNLDLGMDRRLVRYDLEFKLEAYLPVNRIVSDTMTNAYLDILVQ